MGNICCNVDESLVLVEKTKRNEKVEKVHPSPPPNKYFNTTLISCYPPPDEFTINLAKKKGQVAGDEISDDENDKNVNDNPLRCIDETESMKKQNTGEWKVQEVESNSYQSDGNTEKFNVYFMDGDIDVQHKVLSVAKQWEKYGNVKFVKLDTPTKSFIRVSFDSDKNNGSWSYVGTDCENISKEHPTMNLGSFNDKKIPQNSITHEINILHEFGHALAMEHEHQHPYDIVPYDIRKVNARFRGLGWTEEEIKNNILKRLHDDEVKLKTQFKIDVKSIMCYHFDESLLKDECLDNSTFRNTINDKISSHDKYGIYTTYRFNYPKVESIVKIKRKLDVLDSFEMANRSDYDATIYDKYNEKIGKVIKHHATNGVCVEFESQVSLWYEPTSMTIVNFGNETDYVKPKCRFFVGNHVKIMNSEQENKENMNRIGTVILSDKELIKIKFNDQKGYDYKYIDENLLKKPKHPFFYGKISSEYSDTRLKNFPIESAVRVLNNTRLIQEKFDEVGRDDYIASWMEGYNDKEGIVKYHHQTNGIGVLFEDSQIIWYEPGCLKLLKKSTTLSTNSDRLFVNTKVKIQNSKNRLYDNRVGTIGLRIFGELVDEQIAVIFHPENSVLFDRNELVLVDSFFF